MESTASAQAPPWPVIEWREAFRMDIASVDAEHRSLFALVEELGMATAQESIEQLNQYVISHFSNEEKLMEGSHYPDLAEHRVQHRHLTALVAHYQHTVVEWLPALVEELRRLLASWLQSHICIHDLAFGQWYAGWRDLEGGGAAAAGPLRAAGSGGHA
jgi:hemerythrin